MEPSRIPIVGPIHDLIYQSNASQWCWTVFAVLLGAFITILCYHSGPITDKRAFRLRLLPLVGGMIGSASIGTLTAPFSPVAPPRVLTVELVLITVLGLMSLTSVMCMLADYVISRLRHKPYQRWALLASAVYAVAGSFGLLVALDLLARLHRNDDLLPTLIRYERIGVWVTAWMVVFAVVLAAIEATLTILRRVRRKAG